MPHGTEMIARLLGSMYAMVGRRATGIGRRPCNIPDHMEKFVHFWPFLYLNQKVIWMVL